MKRTIMSFVLAFGLIATSIAQDATESTSTPAEDDGMLKSKKGQVITPEVGDFAIGMNASPYLTYLGNVFNTGFNAAPTVAFTAQTPAEIFLKYVADNATVYRAAVRIGGAMDTDKADDGSGGIDVVKASSLTVGLTAGIEKHRSVRGRLYGFYGAEASIDKTPMTDITGTGKIDFTDDDTPASSYVVKGGGTIMVGVNAFVGFEFFVAPKVSLGGEFGWGPSFSRTGIRKVDTNGTVTDLTQPSTSLSLDTNASGSLKLYIYI